MAFHTSLHTLPLAFIRGGYYDWGANADTMGAPRTRRYYGDYWSSTAYSTTNSRYLSFYSSNLGPNGVSKGVGFVVRCGQRSQHAHGIYTKGVVILKRTRGACYYVVMKTIMAIFSIIYGVVSLPIIWLAATDKINFATKKEKKLYKAEGRKIANKLNAVFMTLMSVTIIVFGIVLLAENYSILSWLIPLIAVEALGPIGVLFYVNAKWKKK